MWGLDKNKHIRIGEQCSIREEKEKRKGEGYI